MRIDVVGSKPNPTFPLGEPDVVFLVNGAMSYAHRYSKRTTKIGFASLIFASQEDDAKSNVDRQAVEGVQLDMLYHWSPEKRKLLDQVNFSYKEEEEINERMLRHLAYKFLPIGHFASYIFRDIRRAKEVRKYLLRKQRFLRCSRPSSGMLAVVFVEEMYRYTEINAIGISVFDFSQRFYDKQHVSNNFHAHADALVYKKLSEKNTNIRFLDISRQ